MKERILVCGFGQCGGNFAESFQNLGYNSMAINSSNIDLESNKCRIKYHIPAAFGCHRDMSKALEYAQGYYEHMCDFIDKYFPRQDIVFFVNGLGGGTGAGLVPIMGDIMSKRNSNKTYGAICVMPNINEPIQSIKNALVSYKQITNVQGIRNLYVLDNNLVQNKFEMNDRFVRLFDDVVNISKADNRGVIDESELEVMFKCKGNAVIEEWDELVTGYRFRDSLFTKYKGNAKNIAVSTINGVNLKEFGYKIGYPENRYYGYNDKKNMFLATGMEYPQDKINQFKDIVENYRESNNVNGLDYDCDFNKKKEERVDVKQENKVVFDDSYFKNWM